MSKLVIYYLLLAFVSSSLSYSQSLNNIYSVIPDVQNCKPGTLQQSEIDKVIQRVNQIRILHKLPPLEYEISSQQGSMEGCQNIVASGKSEHIDDPSTVCYTPAGGQARMKSNLYAFWGANQINVNSEDIITGWLIDDKNSDQANEYKVGHRRALINPFLKNSLLEEQMDLQNQVRAIWWLLISIIKIMQVELLLLM